MNKKEKIIVLLLIVCSFFLTTGFTRISKTPTKAYRVYLKGESLGLIKSKKDLEEYIDKKQDIIKKKYNVDKVYVPQDLEIEKEITYSEDLKTTKEIYNEIKDKSPFTILGYQIKIKGITTTNPDGKKKKGKTKEIYVTDRKVFENSIEKAVKSFIPVEEYNKYAEDKQIEIKTTGSMIENIYLKNKVTIIKKNIPINKKIYLNEEELSKYLLFGTTKDQAKYTVKSGDTIEDISFTNKISTEEFLIANPELGDENSLLSEGQVVTLGIINPQFSVVEEDYIVKDEESNYMTETIQDSSKCNNYSETRQNGAKGLNRVTQRIQKINGEIVNTVTVNTEVLKEATKEVVVKGTRSCGGWSSVAPLASRGYFGWPATCGSVSSGFGYRWGNLHDGVDIAGCGYGSPIFAGADGQIAKVGFKYDNGQYIVIKHPNGLHTMYAHLCSGCVYVREGQSVYKGQVIGGMGQTGFATGVHLHFGVFTGFPYYGGRAVNPMSYF